MSISVSTSKGSIVYQLTTTYACGGVIVSQEDVVAACPIYRWMVGKSWQLVLANLRRRKLLVAYVVASSTF